MQRGGFPAKTLVLALFVVGTVYLLYLYNTTLGRLRDAELSAERYRREEETKVAQLQVARELITSLKGKQVSLEDKIMEVMRSKDELQEKCESEKREFTNRLNSLSQQHKMLKSQYDEHEVEQMRLEQEARRVKEEFEQVESQRNQEYQQLKQQKELEISTLKDQLADAQRQNEQLQSQITHLRTQIQNGESQIEYDQALLRNKDSEVASLQQQLANKNAELQQQQELQLQQQKQQRQQFAGVQNMENLQQQQQQQPHQGLQFENNGQQQQQQFVGQQQQQQQGLGQQAAVANMNVGNAGNVNMVGQQDQGGIHAGMAQGGVNKVAQSQYEQQEQQEQQRQQHQQRVAEINELHQVMRPDNAEVVPNPDSAVNAHVDGGHGSQQAQVNNEDHQVRPPNMKGHEGGGGEEEEEVDRQLHRQAGAGPREKDNAGEEGEEDHRHEDPLELKQMQRPHMKVGGGDGEGQHRDVEGEEDAQQQQQHPPVDDVHQRRNVGGRQHGERAAVHPDGL